MKFSKFITMILKLTKNYCMSQNDKEKNVYII